VIVFCYLFVCAVVLVKLSVLAKWLAIERPLWLHLHEVRLSPQSPGGRACLCVFFLCLVCLCCYVFPRALHNIYFIRLWHNIAVLKVPLNTKQTNKHNFSTQFKQVAFNSDAFAAFAETPYWGNCAVGAWRCFRERGRCRGWIPKNAAVICRISEEVVTVTDACGDSARRRLQ